MTIPRLFVGGSGRSGTTVVLESIGQHPDIHAFPIETRFLVDKDGLLDLYTDLTRLYSPTRARSALHRFDRLMRVHLACPQSAPYEGHDLPQLFSAERYSTALSRLIEDLTAFEFSGLDYPAPLRREPRSIQLARRADRQLRRFLGRQPSRMPPPDTAMSIRQGQYRSDSDLLMHRMAEFVDELFVGAAHAAGKAGWCEKTPHNLLHADFLLGLFPDSVMIHVFRDPRAIVQSLRRQAWAPADTEACCRYVEDFYQAWRDVRQRLGTQAKRILEIRLEEFANAPDATLATIWQATGLATQARIPAVKPELVHAWRENTSADERQALNRRLAATLQWLGYSAD